MKPFSRKSSKWLRSATFTSKIAALKRLMPARLRPLSRRGSSRSWREKHASRSSTLTRRISLWCVGRNSPILKSIITSQVRLRTSTTMLLTSTKWSPKITRGLRAPLSLQSDKWMKLRWLQFSNLRNLMRLNNNLFSRLTLPLALTGKLKINLSLRRNIGKMKHNL